MHFSFIYLTDTGLNNTRSSSHKQVFRFDSLDRPLLNALILLTMCCSALSRYRRCAPTRHLTEPSIARFSLLRQRGWTLASRLRNRPFTRDLPFLPDPPSIWHAQPPARLLSRSLTHHSCRRRCSVSSPSVLCICLCLSRTWLAPTHQRRIVLRMRAMRVRTRSPGPNVVLRPSY